MSLTSKKTKSRRVKVVMSIASTQADKKSSNHFNKIKVSGVILVDKPQGMTSQQVVSKVKYLFKSPNHDSKKAGHTGTLDPMQINLIKQLFYLVDKLILVMPMVKSLHKHPFQNLMMYF